MTLRAKVTLAFLFLVLLFIALTVYSIYNIHKLHRYNQALTEVNFKAVDLERQLYHTFDELHRLDRIYLVRKEHDYLYRIKDLQSDFRKKLAELSFYLKSAEENDRLKDIRDLFADYTNTIREPDMLSAVKLEEFDRLEMEKIALKDRLEEQIRELLALSDRAIKDKVLLSAQASNSVEKVLIFFSLGVLAVSMLLAGWIIRRISIPLRKLHDGTQQIASGNFNQRIEVSGNDELAKLARAFNAMTQRLAEIDRITKEFIFKASHDLKAPIGVIKEANDLLLEGLGGDLSAKQKQLLSISRKSCARLQALINDLLDIARIEAGAMEYHMEERDIIGVILSSVQEMEPLAHSRKITLRIDVPESGLPVVLDHMRIAQVMQNLLSNAFKFTPEGGTVSVHVEKVQDATGRVPTHLNSQLRRIHRKSYALVSVSDTGVGVPAEELENIFRSFYQVKQVSAVSGELGTGLGLAIAKSIIEAHNGVIWAERRSDRGSRFCFLLPLAGQAQTESAAKIMSVAKSLFFAVFLLMLSSLPGCSKLRKQVIAHPATGPHPAPSIPLLATLPHIAPPYPAPTNSDTMPHAAPTALTAMTQASDLFAQGKLAEATQAFERLLSINEAMAYEDYLLFQVALLYAQPNNPLYSLRRAKESIERLLARYNQSRYRREAEALAAILNDVEYLRETHRAQESRIKQLQSELEKLREIDLRRRKGQP